MHASGARFPGLAVLVLTVLATLAAAPAAVAGQTSVMTFEEFPNGATNVGGFYGAGVSWVNGQVFNTAGTPALSPFQANVLARTACTNCELELTSTSAIQSVTLSGLIPSGSNLEVRAFNLLLQQVGSFVVDTVQQSVGCSIVTDWSCNRSFDFTQFEGIHMLQFITSGTGVIDNVQVTTYLQDVGSAPEPATVALLALGLAGLRFARRKQH